MQDWLEELESELLARRRAAADVCEAFQSSFALIADDNGGPSQGAIHAAGAMIAAAVQSWPGSAAEPAYHNRHHAVEATLAMGRLCRAALDRRLISGTQAALGVAAMVGHDLDHDGSTIGGGVLEARSWAAARAIAAPAGLEAGLMAALGDVILATDPALVATNAARVRGEAPAGQLGCGQDMLRMLANEADVFASMLPRLGPYLSQRLAEEWRPSGNPVLLHVGTAAGRCAFLRAYPPMSAPAVALGLQAARTRCLDAYVAVAQCSGQGDTAEAGCAVLDAMAPEAAQSAYAAALSKR